MPDGGSGLSAAQIRKQLDDSLQRLQTDKAMKEMNEERKKVVLEDPYLMAAYQLALGMIK